MLHAGVLPSPTARSASWLTAAVELGDADRASACEHAGRSAIDRAYDHRASRSIRARSRPGALFVALRGTHERRARVRSAGDRQRARSRSWSRAAPMRCACRRRHRRARARIRARALSPLAAAFYGDPSHALDVIGVTGTNGKTTTTRMIAAILERGRHGRAASSERSARSSAIATGQLANTTPLPPELHAAARSDARCRRASGRDGSQFARAGARSCRRRALSRWPC